MTLDETTCRAALAEAARRLPPRPETLDGRGVVICAGGTTYFTCAWVCIGMLRRLGCTLPVQVWHLDDSEISDRMRAVIEPLGVELVNAAEQRRHEPAHLRGGWELKAYALLRSRFAEALLLDADNVPVRDPAYLFEHPAYRQTGALFWPDISRFGRDHPIWSLCGIEPRDEPEFESGQMLVDKRRCWDALALALWFNEHSDFFYRHIFGDKDTFHLAFRKLGVPYAMPSRGCGLMGGTLLQHDPDGELVFQHRHSPKWHLLGDNQRVRGFLHEDACRDLLRELRERWLPGFLDDRAPGAEREQAHRLCTGSWRFAGFPHGLPPWRFTLDGAIAPGHDTAGQRWDLRHDARGFVLELMGNARIHLLRPHGDGWSGHWNGRKDLPMELVRDDPR